MRAMLPLRPRRIAACALLALAGATVQAQPVDGEAALRQAVAEALWPGDIVRAADHFLARFPASEAAPAVAALRERAAAAWDLVRAPDLRLYRSTFVTAGPATPRDDLRQAGLGDRAAAVRLAHASRAQGSERWLGWLQYAAALGDDEASYALALHYRGSGQPLLAARYEERAVALGYRPAPSLDHVRK